MYQNAVSCCDLRVGSVAFGFSADQWAVTASVNSSYPSKGSVSHVRAGSVKILGSFAGKMRNTSVNSKLFLSFIFVIIFCCLHLNPVLFPRPFGEAVAMESESLTPKVISGISSVGLLEGARFKCCGRVVDTPSRAELYLERLSGGLGESRWASRMHPIAIYIFTLPSSETWPGLPTLLLRVEFLWLLVTSSCSF